MFWEDDITELLFKNIAKAAKIQLNGQKVLI